MMKKDKNKQTKNQKNKDKKSSFITNLEYESERFPIMLKKKVKKN